VRKQQVLALCVCTILVYAGIGAVIGLLPVHLTRLGADAATIGALLASAYLALALSNAVAGRLAARWQRRRALLILGGALAAPAALLLSRADSVGQVWALLAALWFALGIPMTMASILVGLFAPASQRGRSFGMLALSSGFGLFLGGLVSGPIVDRWGFATLFAAVGAALLLIPLAGLFAQEYALAAGPGQPAGGGAGPFRRRAFTLLFAATLCAQAANIVIFLSRPLLMDVRHFDATTIGFANAAGSAATLPLPLLIGWLADRVGRKALIAACFLAPPLGLLVQLVAARPWHFALSAMLGMVVGASLVVASVLVADLFTEAARGTALALLNAATWAGLVVGLGAGGAAIRALGMMPALLLATLLGLAALLLLVPVTAPATAGRAAPQAACRPAD
jgi:MFS family permease